MSAIAGRITIERPELFTGVRAFRSTAGPIVTLVKGTGHGEWADPGSPFRVQVLEPAGITVAARVDYWSGALFFPKDDWREGGEELSAALQRLPLEARVVLSHSHGLQVVAFTASRRALRTWVSISGPVRRDMAEVYGAATAKTRSIVQIADAGFDRTQWAGQWFGRFLGFSAREFPAGPNVQNLREEGIGHSGLLYDPAHFETSRRLIVPALVR